MARRLLAVVVATAALAGLAGLRLDADGSGRGPPAAGTIRGRVDIRNAAADSIPRPGVAELGQNSTYRAGERRDAVVYLETAPQGAFESGSAAHATMSQRNEAFVPHVLAVRVGTVIDFPNEDTRLPQRVLALEDETLRSGTVPERAVEGGPSG